MQRNMYESIEQLSPESINVLTGSPLDFSHGLLRVVEKGLWGDLEVRYLTIERDGRILAMLPVYSGSNVNINALMPKGLQNGIDRFVRSFGLAQRTSFCIAGNPISDKGWIPMAEDAAGPELVAAMTEHVEQYASSLKVQLCLIKDIHDDFPADWKAAIEHHGFQRTFSLPTVIVNTDFPSFDDYISALKKNARKHARKTLRAAESLLEFESTTDYRHMIDQVFPLLRGTYLKAKYQFDEGNPAFVQACSEIQDMGTELIVARKNGQVVGALINFFRDGEQLNKRIGIDYRQEETPLIYTSLMYQGIRSAVERGCKRVYLGQSTYVPKMRLGGWLEDMYFYVKPYDPLLKLMMPLSKRWSADYMAHKVEAKALEGISV